MVVVPLVLVLLDASLVKPGILLSASSLKSLLRLLPESLFLLLELLASCLIEEWRDPDLESPGDGLLDLLLGDEGSF